MTRQLKIAVGAIAFSVVGGGLVALVLFGRGEPAEQAPQTPRTGTIDTISPGRQPETAAQRDDATAAEMQEPDRHQPTEFEEEAVPEQFGDRVQDEEAPPTDPSAPTGTSAGSTRSAVIPGQPRTSSPPAPDAGTKSVASARRPGSRNDPATVGQTIGFGRPDAGGGDAASSTADPVADTAADTAADSAAEPVADNQTPSNDVPPIPEGTSGGGIERPDFDAPDVDPEPTVALVRLFPSSSELTVGDSLSLTVGLSAGTDVGHVPFHLHFDPTVLQFESGEEGAFLGSDGSPTAFFAGPSSSGNSVVVGLSRLGRVPGVDGSGALCTLQFTAVGPGHAGLAFARANVRDSSNRILPSEFQAVNVRVR